MARIRTIKPDFFRHEALQDIESQHPGQHVMLVFAALWGHCDKEGRFEWRPRSLKLDILPFLDFDLGASLMLLREAGLISQYVHGEKTYGHIHSFKGHQRISGKEAQDQARYPQPPVFAELSHTEAPGKHQGSTGDDRKGREGKGREGKGAEEAEGDGGKTDFERVLDHGAALLRDLETKNTSPIHQWLNAGCDVGKDILPTITRLAPRNPGGWAYFTNAIMDAKATREQPPPQGAARAAKPKPPKMSNRIVF